ncbi:hypothetical protein [Pulveribacter sp.]|uniref:hypothetical protein n=1 Tax=Pulveribacter sp. TaxID=2678893 RepID=UPI0028AA41A3|nr:hypothetical protein [Pulveribacter sp.]
MAGERNARPVRPATPPRELLHHGLVGAVLGFPLAVWLSGALVYHAPYAARSLDDIATYQVAMWVVPPLWAAVVALAFMAPSRRACWLALLAGNALAWALLQAVLA